MEQRCLICDIISGAEEVRVVRDTPELIAYRSPMPLAPVHIIIAPKKHINSFTSIKEEDAALLSKIMLLVPEFARENSIFQCGFRLIANCGPDAGEDEAHLHFHMLGGTRLTNELA